jgi:hypothetical protein
MALRASLGNTNLTNLANAFLFFVRFVDKTSSSTAGATPLIRPLRGHLLPRGEKGG